MCDTSCLLWWLDSTLAKKYFDSLSLDFSLNRFTPFPLDDSIAFTNCLCNVIILIKFSYMWFLVRFKPRAFLVHFNLQLLCLFLNFWNFHLSQILSSLLFAFLVVPQQPVLVRSIFQHNGMEMHSLLMTFLCASRNCGRLWIDNFLNLALFPFQLNIVEVIYSGRNLLSLSKLRNHIKKEAPASYLRMSFFIHELYLIRVAKVRFCVSQTLHSIAQFFLVMFGSLFEQLLHLFIVQDLFVLLNFVLWLLLLETAGFWRSVIFQIRTDITLRIWVNLIF